MPPRSGRGPNAQGQARASFIQPLRAVIRNRGQLPPAVLAVYLDLQTYDWHGAGTWVGQKTIAQDLGVSERTVRNAVRTLQRLGAIEYEARPGHSNLYRVRYAWLPEEPEDPASGEASKEEPPAPAETAAGPGRNCRTPRQKLPHSPAESAVEEDTFKYTQEAEAETDWVPPPTASDDPESRTTPQASQEQTQGKAATSAAEETTPPLVGLSSSSNLMGCGSEDLAQRMGHVDYDVARRDPAEEAVVVELATRFNQIQIVMGKQEAVGIRWQKFLTGFRMMLFSTAHGRSFDEVCLVLDYLRNNPVRAKEIVNKDNKRGVTNTYHLLFLFDRLHDEAVGRQSEVSRMFSKRKVRIADSAPSE